MSEIKVYTLNEVAEIIKVSKRSLYNYIKGGYLPAVKIGREWRVEQENLRQFIAKGKNNSRYGQ